MSDVILEIKEAVEDCLRHCTSRDDHIRWSKVAQLVDRLEKP